jgi:hypothetical protein
VATRPDDDNKTHTFIALTNSTLVGHYRVIEKIGANGIGKNQSK